MEKTIIFLDFLKKKYLEILIISIPFFLITGPFFPDLILSLLSLLFLLKIIINKKHKYIFNYFGLLILLWYLYLLTNSLLSENVTLSLSSSLFYFRFGLFSLALYFVLTNNSIKFSLYFFLTLIFSLTFVAYNGIIQYFFDVDLLGNHTIVPFDSDGRTVEEPYKRISGVFRDELIMGSFLSRLYPLALFLYIYLKIKDNFFHCLFAISSILIFFAIIISGERIALFNILMLIILSVILLVGLKKLKLIITSFLTLVLIFLFSTDLKVKDRLINYTIEQFTNGDELQFFSITHHHLIMTSYNIFKKNIFFGTGPKTYRIECQKFLDTYPLGCSTHPHNNYMQLLSETGLIGSFPIITIFFIICFIFIKQIYYYYIKNQIYLQNHIILSLLPIFISLWPVIPTGNFFNNYISIIYYLPLGYCLYFFNIIKVENDI